jgi:inhibitor of cysteine peptidase
MKYLIHLLMTFLLFNCCFAANLPQNVPVYTDANQIIVVSAVKPSFMLQLKANPTTGYSWSTQNYNKKLLSLMSYQYLPPNSKLIGAGGISVWTFKVTPIGLQQTMSTKINLLYARPWNLKDNPTWVTFIVTHTK